jgi:hypothetical protein
MPNKVYLFAGVIILFLFGNILYLHQQIALIKDTLPTLTARELPADLSSSSLDSSISASISCDKACQNLIDTKLARIKEDLAKSIAASAPRSTGITSITPPGALTTPSTTVVNSSQAKEFFLYFGVSGSTQETDWIDVSGGQINFDISNYPGARAIYFIGNLKSDAPDRSAYARLLNVSSGSAITGSEISFTGLSSTPTTSVAMDVPSGSLKLQVQIKSLNGNLATIENPRVRVIY